MRKNNSAFTLVELAIVIVIIGLLVGGILQGQELIKQAKLRSFYAEHKGYIAAVTTFYAKYNGLPGDINNGFTFFGGSDCTNALVDYANNGCNGDGNKTYGLDKEGLLFWKHLSKAKIIKGYYTGVTSGAVGSTDCCVKAGENSPASGFNNATYWLRITDEGATATIPAPILAYVNTTNHFRYGVVKPGNVVNNWPYYELMSQRDSYEFDLKFDDGAAASGSIIGLNGLQYNNCFVGSGTYDYNLTATTGGCLFILPFF